MILQPIHCIHCHGTALVKFGKTSEGKQRYKCRESLYKGYTFILNYSHLERLCSTKQQIVDMAMNGSGVRDTVQVLHVSHQTVISELKKESQLQLVNLSVLQQLKSE